MCMCPKAGHEGADKEITSPQATDGKYVGECSQHTQKARVWGCKGMGRAARKKNLAQVKMSWRTT